MKRANLERALVDARHYDHIIGLRDAMETGSQFYGPSAATLTVRGETLHVSAETALTPIGRLHIAIRDALTAYADEMGDELRKLGLTDLSKENA